jgi:hypothetical protein
MRKNTHAVGPNLNPLHSGVAAGNWGSYIYPVNQPQGMRGRGLKKEKETLEPAE